MPKEKLRESEIQDLICQYLTVKKIFFWRSNNITASDKGVYRRPGKYFRYGVPDLIGFYKGKTFFIEIKAQDGVLSDNQKVFEQEALKEKIPYLCAKGPKALDQVIEFFRLVDKNQKTLYT